MIIETSASYENTIDNSVEENRDEKDVEIENKKHCSGMEELMD